MSIAQGIRQIPSHRHHNDIFLKMTTLKVYHFTPTIDTPTGSQYIIILREVLFATEPKKKTGN